MSDTEETTETGNQQNILLIISEDGIDNKEENVREGYVVMKWATDIIKRGAHLTKSNIFCVLRHLLEGFREKSGIKLISDILLSDENDKRDDDTEDEDSDNETSNEVDPLLRTSDVRDSDKEITIICNLIEYCNRVHKRFDPKAFDFDPERPELRIAIDDVLDSNGNLRRLLWGHISDIRLSQEDSEYIIKEEVQQKRRLGRTDPPKPCYYPSQEYAAAAIVKRIRFIFDYYHDKRQLERFTEFDFRIYTARSNMLEEQTWCRLCDRRAQCFPAEDYEDEMNLRTKAKQRIRKYVITSQTDIEHKELEQDVLDNPNKLFLIVADEAHWGISITTQLHGTAANHRLINLWDHNKHPNVVVLLVTATPWNLLTENSRLPMVNVAESTDDGRFVVVDLGPYNLRNNRLIEKETDIDVTNKVGSVKELHVFRWTENYETYLKRGFVLFLRVPQRSGYEPIWLTVDQTTSETIFYPITGTNDSTKAIAFLLKGMNGVVTITTEDRSLILTVQGTKVGFAKADSVQDEISSRLFKVHMEHGEGVIDLETVSTGTKLNHLMYTYKSCDVILGPSPADASKKITPKETYCFLIDSQKQCDEIEPGPQYLSLNFYYNSIRNEATEQQLIRSDNESSAMFKELQPKGKTRRRSVAKPAAEVKQSASDYSYDDILAAEYAYYVALLHQIRKIFKIANVLQKPEEWEAYACKRQYILKRIYEELEKKHEVSPIPSAVFEVVVNYVEKKAWDNLQKITRGVKKKNWSRDNSEEFLLNFISYLLHVNTEKLTDHLKEMWERIKIVQPLILEHSPNLKFEKIATKVISQSETFKIINDLIKTGSDVEGEMNGRMKVFRASDIPSGNRFYATLTLARKIGSEEEFGFFEVIRYFDVFKISNHEINASVNRIWQTLQRKECSNLSTSKTFERCDCKEYEPRKDSIDCKHCLHPHNSLKHFNDLDRLPCILIIVENGRMGDTFPQSFNVMDLRARHTSKPKLSSLQQEIGRLCRYQNKSDYSQMPYVLIAPKLMDEFKEGLETCPDLQTSFSERNVDRYTRRSSNTKMPSGRGSLTPNRKNYDFENTTKHHNRLLLQAEPQIGKTGVFLKVISLLRQLITKQPDLEETCSDEEGEDDDEDSEEEESSAEELFEDDWQFPHWKTMANGKPLKKKIEGSKYDRLYGPYIHRKAPQYCGNSKPKSTRHTTKRRGIIPEYRTFRMFNRTEHDACTDCLSSASTILKEWNINMHSQKMLIKISIPRLRRFQTLFDKLNATLSVEEQESQTLDAPNAQPEVNCPKINTWIFNPTYRRSGVATVNYHHSMICQETNSFCQYVQILVVRSEDFAAYCENWQTTHAILQLPETLPQCDVDVNTGGIGFARRAIQMFAEALGLDRIFLLDDSIYQISSVKFSDLPETDNGRRLEQTPEGEFEYEEVSLYTVLKQLESLFDCEKAPKKEFLPYKNRKELLGCRCRTSAEDLHFYTGPSKTYGVLGIRKFRPYTQSIVRGFKKTHVFSFVLLNIRALREKSILYKAWQVREDCNLNNDCDDRGLHVCKFNLFVSYKKPLLSLCSPKMYFWPDDVELIRNNLPRATSSAETTLRWIQMVAPPKRLEVMDQYLSVRTPTTAFKIRQHLNRKLIKAQGLPDNRRKCYSDLRSVLNGLLKTSKGKSHLVACLTSTADIEDVRRYFEGANGIGKFDIHLIILSAFLCHHIQTSKVEHFQEKIINPIFDEQTKFDVVTSHNITEYAVPLVILYIRGKIKSPSDRKKIGNIGLFEIDEDLAVDTEEKSSNHEQSATVQDKNSGSKRTGSQDEDENELKRSPTKKMRPNADQTSSNGLNAKSTEATISIPENIDGDDRDFSVISNSMGVRTIGNQSNPNAIEIQQDPDICSLDELRIYDQRANTLRPLQRGATLSTDEEVVMIVKPRGSRLSASVYDVISKAYHISRDK